MSIFYAVVNLQYKGPKKGAFLRWHQYELARRPQDYLGLALEGSLMWFECPKRLGLSKIEKKKKILLKCNYHKILLL